MTYCGAQRSSQSGGNISDSSVWIDKLRNIVWGIEIERYAFAHADFEASMGNPSEDVSLHLDMWLWSSAKNLG